MPSPRSSESIACLMPATCHSLTSRYPLSASAARNERERPVLFASFSRRFLMPDSTRTLKVVDDMVFLPVFYCLQYNTPHRIYHLLVRSRGRRCDDHSFVLMPAALMIAAHLTSSAFSYAANAAGFC